MRVLTLTFAFQMLSHILFHSIFPLVLKTRNQNYQGLHFRYRGTGQLPQGQWLQSDSWSSGSLTSALLFLCSVPTPAPAALPEPL